MQIRAAGLFDVTGIALVRRVASANVCTVTYEEHTPEPWNAALLASSMPMGAVQHGAQPVRARARSMHTQAPHTEVRPATMRTATALPPPPPPPTQQVLLGEALLPERAHDPKYYPGLVEDLPEEWAEGTPWRRWGLYAGGALAVFGAGLFVAQGSSTPTHVFNAVVDATPADAQVSIDGELLPGANPRSRPGLMRGDHVLTVTHPGFEPHRQVFRLSEGDQRIVVALERETPKPDPSAEETSLAAATQSPESLDERLLSPKELAKKRRAEARAERARQRYRDKKSTSPDDREESAPARSSSSSSSSAGSGLLKLNSIPWSEVYVDKKRVGNTPLLGLTLPAGKHTIRLSNPQLGLEKTLRIKLKAGETITKVEKLGG